MHLKAPRLQPGDTVGIVSPSFGGAGMFPHRTELGVKQLETMGFKVKIAPHSLNMNGHVSDSAENRAADIHSMFVDPEVKAIIAAIGGDHACQLLPHLDVDLIRQNPKIFIGYSDITVLNVALQVKTGLVTFNGPALLTDFAEYPRMMTYTKDYFLKALCETDPVGQIDPATEWTDEFLDWGQKLDLTRPRTLRPSPGWTWLKPGQATGRLMGGCIGSMEHLRGTPYWPEWDGAILSLEGSEEKPSPARWDCLLMDYENMGVFDQIAGMLVGRPYDFTDEEKAALRAVVVERTKKYDFPIITGMDFGHTGPQFTLPLGCKAEIDSEKQRFAIIEAAVC
jgi:muramoyltetrapeptide carboxypeptidase